MNMVLDWLFHVPAESFKQVIPSALLQRARRATFNPLVGNDRAPGCLTGILLTNQLDRLLGRFQSFAVGRLAATDCNLSFGSIIGFGSDGTGLPTAARAFEYHSSSLQDNQL